MNLNDDLVDLTMRLKGLQGPQDAARTWPAVLTGLATVVASVKRLKPARRRLPEVYDAVCWLHRTLADAPIDADRRAQASALVLELAELVGASQPEWRPVEPKRPSGRPRSWEKSRARATQEGNLGQIAAETVP